MANLIRQQKLIDNNKRALLKCVFISDGTNEANTVLVDVSNLGYALNANGYIMVSNTHPKTTYRTTIKRVFGNVTSNGNIKLQWHGDSNSEIIAAGSGRVDFNFDSQGDVAVIPNNEANSSGDILLSTAYAKAGDVFTLMIDLRKDARDYDAGQTADPVAFNRGPAAP